MYIILIDDSRKDLAICEAKFRIHFPNSQIKTFIDVYSFNLFFTKNDIEATEIQLIVTDLFMLGSYEDVRGLAKQLKGSSYFTLGGLFKSKAIRKESKDIPIVAFSKFIQKFDEVLDNAAVSSDKIIVVTVRNKVLNYLREKEIRLISKWDVFDSAQTQHKALDRLISVARELTDARMNSLSQNTNKSNKNEP